MMLFKHCKSYNNCKHCPNNVYGIQKTDICSHRIKWSYQDLRLITFNFKNKTS